MEDTGVTMTNSGQLLGESYVTVAEAMEILDLERRTVQRMAKAGKLPVAHKMPGRCGQYLFSRQVVELIASQQEDAE